jgi:site-specific DNA recombinase
MVRFAFYGRVSTEDQQDPASSKAWQLQRSQQLIDTHGEIVEEFFDIGQSRSLPWKRRPEASRLLASFARADRGFDAVVVGEPQRAFYGNQFGLTFPILTHYRVTLWVPEVGGPVDPGSEAHDLVMTLFGAMSKGERMRIKTRVKAAMDAQAATQGRFLGGRPPYGYRLVGIGRHPHPEKAALGVQLHQLEPEPATAPVVKRIYAEFLAGRGYFAIAESLSADGIPSPSAHDRARNTHRPGYAWAKSAVRTILANPRYTGYQVWGKQRRDEVLVDVEDVAAGHETVMRWNHEATWTWSTETVHQALVTRDDFEAVQQIIASNTRRQGPRTRKSPNVYPLRGILRCAMCGRRMQGHQARDDHYYRCRYSAEYARSAALHHPTNVYLREDDVLPQIDDWLEALFAPDRIDATIDLLLDAIPEDRHLRDRRRIEDQIRDLDRKISNYRKLLDHGTDPALVSTWLNETGAARQMLERNLAILADSGPPIDRNWLAETIANLAG